MRLTGSPPGWRHRAPCVRPACSRVRQLGPGQALRHHPSPNAPIRRSPRSPRRSCCGLQGVAAREAGPAHRGPPAIWKPGRCCYCSVFCTGAGLFSASPIRFLSPVLILNGRCIGRELSGLGYKVRDFRSRGGRSKPGGRRAGWRRIGASVALHAGGFRAAFYTIPERHRAGRRGGGAQVCCVLPVESREAPGPGRRPGRTARCVAGLDQRVPDHTQRVALAHARQAERQHVRRRLEERLRWPASAAAARPAPATCRCRASRTSCPAASYVLIRPPTAPATSSARQTREGLAGGARRSRRCRLRRAGGGLLVDRAAVAARSSIAAVMGMRLFIAPAEPGGMGARSALGRQRGRRGGGDRPGRRSVDVAQGHASRARWSRRTALSSSSTRTAGSRWTSSCSSFSHRGGSPAARPRSRRTRPPASPRALSHHHGAGPVGAATGIDRLRQRRHLFLEGDGCATQSRQNSSTGTMRPRAKEPINSGRHGRRRRYLAAGAVSRVRRRAPPAGPQAVRSLPETRGPQAAGAPSTPPRGLNEHAARV